MAKTQCGVSLAFAALRKADGGFAIATFPTLTADPTWSVEAIDELVRQTWDDPHLSGGTVLVRSGRVLKGMWTGQGHHIKLAAAALSDPEAPDHPWGLLCVAEPLAGHFEQDQLNLLGNLAVRLTSYLRARQQVLEGSPSFDQGAGPAASIREAEPESAHYEPMVETPFVAPAPAAAPEPPAPAVAFEAAQFERPVEIAEAVPPRAGSAATTEPPTAGWGSSFPEQPRSGEWDFLGLDEIDWVEAPAPIAQPQSFAEPSAVVETTVSEVPTPPVVEAVPEQLEARVAPSPQTRTFGTREQEPPAPAAQMTGTSDLEAMLGPDPVTGLATLTSLVGRLAASLAHVRNNEGTVGLILVDVAGPEGSEPLGTTALLTVSGRLTNHLRDRDLVARIGPALFALLVDLRPGAVELDTIRERTVGTLTEGMASNTGGLRPRSSMVSAGGGSTVSAEELLRQAADQLLGR